MKIFKRKEKTAADESINPWKEKYEALEKDYKYVKSIRNREIREATEKAKEDFQKEIYMWQKEATYWKEKALNFKKFHQ